MRCRSLCNKQLVRDPSILPLSLSRPVRARPLLTNSLGHSGYHSTSSSLKDGEELWCTGLCVMEWLCNSRICLAKEYIVLCWSFRGAPCSPLNPFFNLELQTPNNTPRASMLSLQSLVDACNVVNPFNRSVDSYTPPISSSSS
jgi:hypothetical protein